MVKIYFRLIFFLLFQDELTGPILKAYVQVLLIGENLIAWKGFIKILNCKATGYDIQARLEIYIIRSRLEILKTAGQNPSSKLCSQPVSLLGDQP